MKEIYMLAILVFALLYFLNKMDFYFIIEDYFGWSKNTTKRDIEEIEKEFLKPPKNKEIIPPMVQETMIVNDKIVINYGVRHNVDCWQNRDKRNLIPLIKQSDVLLVEIAYNYFDPIADIAKKMGKSVYYIDDMRSNQYRGKVYFTTTLIIISSMILLSLIPNLLTCIIAGILFICFKNSGHIYSNNYNFNIFDIRCLSLKIFGTNILKFLDISYLMSGRNYIMNSNINYITKHDAGNNFLLITGAVHSRGIQHIHSSKERNWFHNVKWFLLQMMYVKFRRNELIEIYS